MSRMEHGTSVEDNLERLQIRMPWATEEEPYEYMRRLYTQGGTGE